MASILTQLGSGTGSYATSRSTAAFTPSANRLLLCFVQLRSGASPEISSVTGHDSGESWRQIYRLDTGSNVAELWACVTGASPSSASVTVNHASCPSNIVVLEPVRAYSATTINDVILQVKDDKGYNVTNLIPEMGEFSDTNAGVAIFVSSHVSNTPTFTEQGSLTQDYETTGTGFGLHVSSIDSNDQTPQVNLQASNYNYNVAIAIELKATPVRTVYCHPDGVSSPTDPTDPTDPVTVYDSLASAETGEQGDIASELQSLEIVLLPGTYHSTATITFDDASWTTSADYDITIRGSGYRGHVHESNLYSNVSSAAVLDIESQYCNIYDLKIKHTVGTAASERAINGSSSPFLTVEQCWLEGGEGIWIDGTASGTAVMRNCVVIGSGSNQAINCDDYAKISHCTVINPGSGNALNVSSATGTTIEHCYLYSGSGTALSGTAGTQTNIHTDDTSGDTDNVSFNTTNFNTVTGPDYDLRLPDGSALRNAASASSETKDMSGNTRVVPDVGAFERVDPSAVSILDAAAFGTSRTVSAGENRIGFVTISQYQGSGNPSMNVPTDVTWGGQSPDGVVGHVQNDDTDGQSTSVFLFLEDTIAAMSGGTISYTATVDSQEELIGSLTVQDAEQSYLLYDTTLDRPGYVSNFTADATNIAKDGMFLAAVTQNQDQGTNAMNPTLDKDSSSAPIADFEQYIGYEQTTSDGTDTASFTSQQGLAVHTCVAWSVKQALEPTYDIRLIQKNPNSTTHHNISGQTSDTANLTNIRQGNMLVVAGSAWHDTPASVTISVSDTINGDWNSNDQVTEYETSNGDRVFIAWFPNSAPGDATITVTWSATAYANWSAYQFNNVSISSPLDTSGTSKDEVAGSSNSVTSTDQRVSDGKKLAVWVTSHSDGVTDWVYPDKYIELHSQISNADSSNAVGYRLFKGGAIETVTYDDDPPIYHAAALAVFNMEEEE